MVVLIHTNIRCETGKSSGALRKRLKRGQKVYYYPFIKFDQALKLHAFSR